MAKLLTYCMLLSIASLPLRQAAAQDCNSFFIGGRSIDVNYSIELDALGNVFTAGVTSDTTYFSNSGTILTDYDYPGVIPECMFISKSSTGGTLDWFIPLNIIAYELFMGDVTVNPIQLLPDENGGVFVSGYYFDHGDFMGIELPELNFYFSYFLAHINPNGTLDWLETSEVVGPFNSSILDLDFLGNGSIIALLYSSFETEYDGEAMEGSTVLEVSPEDGTLLNYYQDYYRRVESTENYYDVLASDEIIRYDNNHDLISSLSVDGVIHDFRSLPNGEIIMVKEDLAGHFLSHNDIEGTVINEIALETNNFRALSTNESQQILIALITDEGLIFQIYDDQLALIREEQFGQVLPSSNFATNISDIEFIDDDIFAVGGTSGEGEVDFICSTATLINNGDGFYARVGLGEIDQVSIDNDAAVYSIVAYPNPFRTILNIQVPNLETGNSYVTIVDACGKTVFYDQIKSKNSDIISLQLEHLNRGLYFLRIHDPGRRVLYSSKLIRN